MYNAVNEQLDAFVQIKCRYTHQERLIMHEEWNETGLVHRTLQNITSADEMSGITDKEREMRGWTNRS